MVNNQEIFPKAVFNSSNQAFWDTERNTKNAALYKALFLKKSRKTSRNWPFLTKKLFWTIFRQFFPNTERKISRTDQGIFIIYIIIVFSMGLGAGKQISDRGGEVVYKQGSSENDGRSDVIDRFGFKIVSNCCYNNCCRTNCSHFIKF